MQSLMDTYCGTAPLLILGDMNTSLPHTSLRYQNWCKKTPSNSYSVILYNSIVDNNLYVVNFMYDQNVNFTIAMTCNLDLSGVEELQWQPVW